MSLHVLAQHMASHGRGPDKTLVHMSPGEVMALRTMAQAHGGDLTTNPKTGLPEAGFLSSILPAVAGYFLGPAGMGMSSLGAAATVGGIQALSSKNLSSGLMAGLGAYGGSEIGGAASNMGADAAAMSQMGAPTAENAAEFAKAREAAIQGARSQTATAGLKEGFNNPSAFLSNLGNGSTMSGAGKLYAAAAPIVADQSVQTKTKAPASEPGYIRQARFDPQTQRYVQYDPVRADQWGGRQFADGGMTGDSAAAYDFLMGGPRVRRPYSAQFSVIAPVSVDKLEGGTGKGKYVYDPVTKTYKYVEDASATAGPVTGPFNSLGNEGIAALYGGTAGPGDAPNGGVASAGISSGEGIGGTPVGIAAGMVANAVQGMQAPAPVSDAVATPVSQDAVTAAIDAGMANDGIGVGGVGGSSGVDGGNGGIGGEGGVGLATGGIANLGSYSDGGQYLKGPGDGVSDSIPAQLENGQPAKLANNEFVIPARIVSELGNGSSDAGAQKLYAMMDRIQKARAKTVGKGKIAVNSRADKHLPA